MMKKKIGISKLKSFFQITFFKSSNSIKAINHQFGITHFQIKSSFHFSQSKEIKNNEKPKFEQITNSHDLASTLLSLKNTSDILTLYENNQPLFKRPDVILALKMIARSINTEDEDLNLNLDKILSKISEIIQKDVEILTPTGFIYLNIFTQNL